MVKNWKNIKLDLGIIRPYSKKSITFECIDSLADVETITASCKCVKTKVEGDSIVASFQPGDIPKHLLLAKIPQYKFNKTVKVYYKNGECDLLQFNGIVRR